MKSYLEAPYVLFIPFLVCVRAEGWSNWGSCVVVDELPYRRSLPAMEQALSRFKSAVLPPRSQAHYNTAATHLSSTGGY